MEVRQGVSARERLPFHYWYNEESEVACRGRSGLIRTHGSTEGAGGFGGNLCFT